MSLGESKTVTTVTVTAMGPEAGCGPKMPYLTQRDAILKYVEMALGLGNCICAGMGGGGGVVAVIFGALHIVGSALLYMGYFCNCIYRVPRHAIGQLGYYAIMDIGLLVGAIICSAEAAKEAALGVAAAFGFGELIAAGACTYFAFRYFQGVGK